MKLPLLISVPHAGLRVPAEAAPFCILNPLQIQQDGDEGAAAIYFGLEPEATAFVSTDVARAIVDLNRAPSDRSRDGVVKTHTCWNVPIYNPFPPEEVIADLLDRYYFPYHRRLTKLAGSGAWLGVDCHTMAAKGPPVGPDPGLERPWVCLSNADGTCPQEWMRRLHQCFACEFENNVQVNSPFQGGSITRTHAAELPWVQLELSRAPFYTLEEKRRKVFRALTEWVEQTAPDRR